MKIVIGLSDKLALDEKWVNIWQQLAENTGDFPFMLVDPNSEIVPWYVLDWQNGPFIFSLEELKIQAALTEFCETGRIGFYLRSVLLTFLLQKAKQVSALEAIYPDAILAEEIEIDLENSASKFLTVMKGDKYLNRYRVKFYRINENSLAVICLDEKVVRGLKKFFDKMEKQGWEFKRFEGSS